MGKGRSLILAGLAALALLGAVAFWVLQMGAELERGLGAGGGREVLHAPQAEAPAPAVAPAAFEPAVQPLAPAPADIAAPSVHASATAAPGQPLPLSGRVVDDAGQPVPGAIVRLLPSFRMRKELGLPLSHFDAPVDPARLASSASGADGRFAFEARDLPQPESAIVDTSENQVYGFDGRWPELVVSHPAHETSAYPCLGWRGGPFAAGDLALRPGASLTGRTVDEDGRPLAGVAVGAPPFFEPGLGKRTNEWRSVRGLLRTASGDDGRFRLDGLWAGDMACELRAPGRVTLTRKLQLAGGRATDLGDVVLGRGGALEGRVVGAEDGRPIADAKVVARPARRAHLEGGDLATYELSIRMASGDVLIDHETRTDADGEFRFEGLDPQHLEWNVAAGAKGFEAARVAERSLDGDPLLLSLVRPACIVLTLLDEASDEPVAGALVEGRRHASQGGWSWTRLDVTTEAAALAAAGVPEPHAGTYLLTPAGSLSNDAVISAPGYATREAALPAVPAPGRALLALRLRREARLEGRVTDAAGAPVADAALSAERADVQSNRHNRIGADPDRAKATSGADGHFRFSGLGDGEWELGLVAPGFVRPEPRRVQLVAGEAAPEQAYVLLRGGALAGSVLSAGAPQAGWMVVARLAAEVAAREAAEAAGEHRVPKVTSYKVQTDAAGRFLLEALAPGEYELSGPPGVQVLATVEAGRTTEVDLLARARPRVRGRVSDAHGPVAGAAVDADEWFDPVEGWMEHDASSITAADGSFDHEVFGPGRFRLSARDAGAVTPAVELTLDWDQVEWVELRFGGGELRGRVVDATTGAAVEGANVRIMGTQDGAVPVAPGGKVARKLQSDAQGLFEALRLPAGPWAVLLDHPRYVTPAPVVVQVEEGVPSPVLELPLAPGGRVLGTLRPALPGGALPADLRVRCVALEAQGDTLRTGVAGDGRFERWGLAPGRWRCEVAAAEPADAPALAAAEVLVVAGEACELELTLPE